MNLLIIRLIIFAVLFWAGLKLYRMYRDWKLEREAWERKEAGQEGGHMVRCDYCQVHLPEDEALREQGHWFCGTPHRDKYLAEQPPSD
ncbi:PP0621 family protein [Onishia taeanensis]